MNTQLKDFIMKRMTVILLLMLYILTSCNNKGVRTMQLIPDNTFSTGFIVKSQKDHGAGDKVTDLGVFPKGTDKTFARWAICQWDSGECLWAGRDVSSPDNVLTDGTYRTVTVNKGNILLSLNTEGYYKGKPAVMGDYWPHLLIEQSSFSYKKSDEITKEFYHADCDKIVLEFDVQLTEYKETPVKKDWVRAAQLLMYFYIRSEKGDFLWFGIQLFDNRSDNTEHYIGYDGGKADASGAMIFSVGSKYVYKNSKRSLWKGGKPYASNDWIHVKIDIKPFIKEAFQRGMEDGYFKAGDISELYIDGMNYGFETIGTFSHSASLKDLKLISYRND